MLGQHKDRHCHHLLLQSVKKELAAAAPAMSKLLGPAIEKSVQDALIKGDGNKDLSQVRRTGAEMSSHSASCPFAAPSRSALSLRFAVQSLTLDESDPHKQPQLVRRRNIWQQLTAPDLPSYLFSESG